MKVYIYQVGWTGNIKMVSTNGVEIYEKAWNDFCEEIGKKRVCEGFENENKAFIAFMENHGSDDWEITEWEI